MRSAKTFILQHGLWLILAFNLLLHLPFLNQPPRSIHVWRQCNTLALARNFYEIDMNILYPRIDRVNETNGITGANFPAYEWTLACLYQVFGEHIIIHRLLTLFCFSAGIVWMFLLLMQIFRDRSIALAGTWLFCFSPELLYHGINALPDIPALSLSLGGLLYFLRWLQKPRWGTALLSALLIMLSGLIKFQFLAVGFAIFGLTLSSFRTLFAEQRVKHALMLLPLALSPIPVYCWYRHSLDLIKLNNLKEFGLWLKPISSGQLWQTIQNNLFSDIPETIAGYGLFACVLLGIYAFIKQKLWRSRWFLPISLWTAALLVYYGFAIERMMHHSYYFIPFIPVMVIAGCAGIKHIPDGKFRGSVIPVLLTLACLQSCLRIIPSRWLSAPSVPMELYHAESREQLQRAVPDSSKCVVGPDISGCIYFYYLHKKGYSWELNSELTMLKEDGRPYIEHMIKHGVQYIYTSDRNVLNNDTLKQYLLKPVTRVGNFEVWQLRE